MAGRFRNMTWCFAGCVISSLLGMYLTFTLGNCLPALVSALAIPSLACWLAGVSNRGQLIKISVYSGVGWMLMAMLQPMVSQTAASRAARIAELPLVGYDFLVLSSVVATLLALVGAFFIPNETPSGQQL